MQTRKLVWIAVYALAMAYAEAAAVVYLRRVFGVVDLLRDAAAYDPRIAAIEIGREAATLVMLLAVGFAAGRSRQARLGFALFAFGTWDILYYVWLKVLLGWPESLATQDVLFLIPMPWWGPVIAPVLVALLLLALGALLVVRDDQGRPRRAMCALRSKGEYPWMEREDYLLATSSVTDPDASLTGHRAAGRAQRRPAAGPDEARAGDRRIFDERSGAAVAAPDEAAAGGDGLRHRGETDTGGAPLPVAPDGPLRPGRAPQLRRVLDVHEAVAARHGQWRCGVLGGAGRGDGAVHVESPGAGLEDEPLVLDRRLHQARLHGGRGQS